MGDWIMTYNKVKIPDSVKEFLENNEDCKQIDKSGVFTKTYTILTNKRLLVVKKGSKLFETSFVSNNEENVTLTKPLTLITTKRLIALSWKKESSSYEMSFDVRYAEENEIYISHRLNGTLWIDKSEYGGRFLIITNNRLLLYSYRIKEFKLIKSIDIDDFQSVDMFRIKILSSDKSVIVIKRANNRPPIIIEHSLFKRDEGEIFPRKLAEAAGISFATPVINSIEKLSTFVEFYPKENIQFPSKCSKCGKANNELQIKTLKLEKTILIEKSPYVGLDSVTFNVPYCPYCYLGKAVKKNAFDGIRAILEFKNSDYANEFIELNTN
jgi:hypothetical protein